MKIYRKFYLKIEKLLINGWLNWCDNLIKNNSFYNASMPNVQIYWSIAKYTQRFLRLNIL